MSGGAGKLEARAMARVLVIDDEPQIRRALREWTRAPVIVLSVREGEADKIRALDLGADDYLTKPFSLGELLARLRAVLRRSGGEEGKDPPAVTVGELQ